MNKKLQQKVGDLERVAQKLGEELGANVSEKWLEEDRLVESWVNSLRLGLSAGRADARVKAMMNAN